MKPSDVVVTGIGMVTPLGATAAATGEAWRAGRCAPRRTLPELAGTPLADAEVAVLPEFDAAARLGGRRMLKFMSDAAVLGCLAAREASEAAALKQRFRPERVGLFAGTGLAPACFEDIAPALRASIDETGQFSWRLAGERGLTATNPLLAFKLLANMPPCLVSILECVKGANLVLTPWEGQTGAAIEQAWSAVASGEVDAAMAGAADYPVYPGTVFHLRDRQALRDGEYTAPGAAYVVLERAESAERDGQSVHAHLAAVEVAATDGPTHDPLAERMGRTLAAAPAILLALACQEPRGALSLCGVDRHEFRAEVKEPR